VVGILGLARFFRILLRAKYMSTNEFEVKQSSFEGWAIVEMMGHRKEIGFVTTQAFGQAVLFRVDTPELPEREFTLESPEYAAHNGSRERWCPAGTKVKRAASPARSCLVAPSSLYAINPCTEQAALTAIERSMRRPLIALELPEQAALPPAPDDEESDFEDDQDDGDEYGD
jgi:hypothetical protein